MCWHWGVKDSRLVESIHIVSLADHPHWISELARWHVAEWQHLYPGWTVQQAEAELARHVDPLRIPTTLVAVEAGGPVGSVSLIEQDLPGWDHLSPWLASLFVRHGHRQQGIGKLLVAQATAKAREVGCHELYLFTPGQQEFYSALGWDVIAQTVATDQQVTVMSKRL